jgi:hypothetical protein
MKYRMLSVVLRKSLGIRSWRPAHMHQEGRADHLLLWDDVAAYPVVIPS